MNETGMIFTTESVRAILDGRKTQTRRVIKPCSSATVIGDNGKVEHPDWVYTLAKCPYGQVGDRLWVRETWRIESFMEGEPLLFGYKDGQTIEENEYSDTLGYESWYERVCIQSTEEASRAFEQGLVRQDKGGYYRWDIGKSPCRWRSSRFMPRWASRITLEITEVRVERLQEITRDDVLAEGVSWQAYKQDYKRAYSKLWDSLNAKRGYGWETNPWVWVISFATGVRLK